MTGAAGLHGAALGFEGRVDDLIKRLGIIRLDTR